MHQIPVSLIQDRESPRDSSPASPLSLSLSDSSDFFPRFAAGQINGAEISAPFPLAASPLPTLKTLPEAPLPLSAPLPLRR